MVGCGCLLIGGFDVYLLFRGTPVPEKVTIAELGALDGTDNAHLTITDFKFGDGVVIEHQDGRWRRVWIPLLTLDGTWTRRPVVLYVNGVSNEIEFARFLESQALSVTGIVTNYSQSLGRSQRNEFGKYYPNDNLDGALAVQFHGQFPSPFVAFPLVLGGAVAFFLGIAMAFGLVGRNWLSSLG